MSICRDRIFRCAAKRKKHLDSEKHHSPPPPATFKLNGCFLISTHTFVSMIELTSDCKKTPQYISPGEKPFV